jgi:hypothetical protein
MSRKTLVALFVFIASLAGVGVAEQGPELPSALWAAITHQRPMAMVWCDWGAVENLPFIRLALEAEDPDLVEDLPMLGSALRAVMIAAPIVGGVEDVWCGMSSVDGRGGDSAWMKTELDPDQLRARLESAGWRCLQEDGRRYSQPLDQGFKDWLLKQLDAERADPDVDLEQAEANAYSVKWQIVVGDGGWIHVAPSGYHVESADDLFSPDLEDFGPGMLTFPFGDLISDDRALCRMAIDVPGNEAEEERALEEAEALDVRIRLLERQLRVLEDQDESGVLRGTGDMLLTVTETDGGIALDLDVAMPSGVTGELSAQVVEAGIGVIRLMFFWVGPELSRDLGSAVIHDAGEGVKATAVVNRSSIYNAIERFLEHGVEVVRLKEQIEDLRKQQRREEESASDDRPF